MTTDPRPHGVAVSPNPLVSRAGLSWRAVGLTVTGILLGVLLASSGLARVIAVSVAPAATARWASCAGLGFYPRAEDLLYATVADAAQSARDPIRCALSLPHGARVTAVKFHMSDFLVGEAIDDCIVGRTRLNPPNGAWQRIAGPMSSGGPFDGGYVTRTDTSISLPVVNNGRYAYWASCEPSVANTGLLLYGVSVRYTPA
jgi:hypothetical protein